MRGGEWGAPIVALLTPHFPASTLKLNVYPPFLLGICRLCSRVKMKLDFTLFVDLVVV